MAKKPSPNARIGDRMESEMQDQVQRLIKKLQGEFDGPDRANVSAQKWQDVIRQNWTDPMWRMAQAQRMGEVAFVQDAMKAFGLDPKHVASLDMQPGSHMDMASQGLKPAKPLHDIQPLPRNDGLH